MPRSSRAVLPGYPHHLVQRGHDRNAVFIGADDYRYYLDTLGEWSVKLDVRVHAYCLMTNHVHLLLEPASTGALGALMKRLAGRQTRFRNRLEGRRGTLWEGRYKSSIVDAETYLHACIRYIELNPVRARLASDPSDYPWSSYAAHASCASETWLLPVTGVDEAYGDYICAGLHEDELILIREAVQRCQLTGGDRFVDQVEAALGRRIERRGPGRVAGIK